jgi:HAMP domain-containing protein
MALVAARLTVRLIALVLSATLAVAGLGVAVFSAQGDTSPLSLPSLAGHLRLDDVRVSVGVLLADLQADGPVAGVAALAGAGAVMFGVLLLFGVLARRRERLVVMRSDDAGTLAARPRALGQAAVTLGEQSRDVLHAKAKAVPKRHGAGGRLRLTAYHARSSDATATTTVSRDRVRALAESFSLGVRVRSRVPRRGARVS